MAIDDAIVIVRSSAVREGPESPANFHIYKTMRWAAAIMNFMELNPCINLSLTAGAKPLFASMNDA
jgi:hypothetical protein